MNVETKYLPFVNSCDKDAMLSVLNISIIYFELKYKF